jgi:Lrp/AsnC family leucine-responsive transcriptional regulator
MIDVIDTKILSILQSDARLSNAQIARNIGLAPSGVLERIRKLEKRGIVTGYHTSLDAAKVGFGMTAFLLIQTDDRPGDTKTAYRLAEIPEVEEVHYIAGDDSFLLKLRYGGHEDLSRLLREKIGAVMAVKSVRTSIVLETIKENGALPIGE